MHKPVVFIFAMTEEAFIIILKNHGRGKML
jgi:hypothetical protein